MADLSTKIAEAVDIVYSAVGMHFHKHEMTARVVLFSGGNDSTTLAHLFAGPLVPTELRATHAAHANTTIGVERTRQFVRDTSVSLGLPLVERKPPVSYADLVAEQGFPGPAMHYKMYQRLKERALRQVRAEFVHDPRHQRVLFIAGRRRTESDRRSGIPLHERVGSTVWASPFADWTKDDLNAYREVFDVPRNPVADELGMSGECLCGAFAEPGEFERIEACDPDSAAHIRHVEALALANGVPEQKCRWGWGAYRADPSKQPIKSGPLCSSCDARRDLLADLVVSPEVAAVRARRQARA